MAETTNESRGITPFLIATAIFSGAIAAWLHLARPDSPQTLWLAVFGYIVAPFVATLIGARFGRQSFAAHWRIWPVTARAAFGIALVVAGVVLITYLIEYIIGVTDADWQLRNLQDALPTAEEQGLPAPVPPLFLLLTGFIITFLLGIVLYPFFLLPLEIAWRGFFTGRLLEDGRVYAYGLTGIVTGLWLLPLALAPALAQNADATTPGRTVLFAIIAAFILGEILRRTGNVALCAIALGSWAGHATGIAVYLFPGAVGPWNGPLGFVSAVVLALAAVILFRWPEPTHQQTPHDTGELPVGPK